MSAIVSHVYFLLVAMTFVVTHAAVIGDKTSISLEQSFGLGPWRARCDVSFEAFAGASAGTVIWRASAMGAGVFDADAVTDARAALDSDSFLRVRVVQPEDEGDFAVVGATRMVSRGGGEREKRTVPCRSISRRSLRVFCLNRMASAAVSPECFGGSKVTRL